MKTTLSLAAKRCANTDYSPQLLFFLNGSLLDEQIVATEFNRQDYDLDLEFEEGWNTFSIFIGDTGWSTTYGPSWELNVLNLTIGESDTFPIDRGQGLKPFMLKFDPSNVVIEVQNSAGLLAKPNYMQLCGKPVDGDCSFGFCFKVEDGKIVDHYYENIDSVDSWETLNVPQLAFIKFIRIALGKDSNKIEEYLSIGGDTTAEKYWKLPVIKQTIPRIESLIDYCAKKPWVRATIYRNFEGQNLSTDKLIQLLSPIE